MKQHSQVSQPTLNIKLKSKLNNFKIMACLGT